MATIINNRKYTVERLTQVGDYPAFRQDLIRRGFDGDSYILTGARGAVKMAYRNAATGQFEIAVG